MDDDLRDYLKAWGERMRCEPDHPGLPVNAVLDRIAEVSGGVLVDIVNPEDGTCAAEGCSRVSVHSSLLGIAFCRQHFDVFYSDAPCPLKADVLVLTTAH